jgi:hypothetical protein
LPDRVTAVACLAGIAPFTEDFDWYAGMTSDGGLRAAAAGREARARFAATDEFDPESFIPADWAALSGDWASLGADAVLAGSAGPAGLIDDDVAFATPWGFDLAAVVATVLLVQGGQDRVVPPAHADWLHQQLFQSELWLRQEDGHISVLGACPAAMHWLSARPPYGDGVTKPSDLTGTMAGMAQGEAAGQVARVRPSLLSLCVAQPRGRMDPNGCSDTTVSPRIGGVAGRRARGGAGEDRIPAGHAPPWREHRTAPDRGRSRRQHDASHHPVTVRGRELSG